MNKNSGVFFEKSLTLEFWCGEVILNNCPNNRLADSSVIVNQNVAKTDDLTRVAQFRVCSLELRELRDGFTNDARLTFNRLDSQTLFVYASKLKPLVNSAIKSIARTTSRAYTLASSAINQHPIRFNPAQKIRIFECFDFN